MKLAEVLMERADKQRYLAELHARIERNVTYQEGDNPSEDPEALIRIYEQVSTDIEKLIVLINKANHSIRLSDGTLMVEALAKRHTLRTRHSFYKSIADAGIPNQHRYSQTEIKRVSAVNVAALQKQADDIAKKLRDIDVKIQEANWNSEVD